MTGTPATHAVTALLAHRATEQPDQAAYIQLDSKLAKAKTLTYGQLLDQVKYCAGALRHHAEPGTPILLAMPNGLETLVLFWSALWAGLIPVPAPAPDPRQGKTQALRLQQIINASGARLAIVEKVPPESPVANCRWLTTLQIFSNRASPAELPVASSPDQIAYLQFSSGSTRTPQGVMISHDNLLAHAKAVTARMPLHASNHRFLTWLPWFHDYGLVYSLIHPLYAGIPSYLMPTLTFMRQPLKWLDAIAKHRITHSGAPDFAYRACIQAYRRQSDWQADLGCWQQASCGAEVVRASTVKEFAASFAPMGFNPAAFTPAYGLAEAVLVVSFKINDAQPKLHTPAAAPNKNLVSNGSPIPGLDVKIVNPDTACALNEGEIGEIWVSGPSVAQGYWRQPEQTLETFHAMLASDVAELPRHYLRTGDLGLLHQGELYIAGRIKDLIILQGRKVHPEDLEATIENVALACGETIHGVAAIGLKADESPLGEEGVAVFVEATPRVDSEKLIENIKQAMVSNHELAPIAIQVLQDRSLPRTSSGKLQHTMIKHLFLTNGFSSKHDQLRPPIPQTPETTDPLSARIREIWAAVLGTDTIPPNASFFELGGDSLLATQVITRINSTWSLQLPIRAIFEATTVVSLAERVQSAQRQPTTAMRLESPSLAVDKVDSRLSFSQERMWFMAQLSPTSTAYNVPLAINLEGPLDNAALQLALADLVARHEVLRTSYTAKDGKPSALIQAPFEPRLHATDLTHLDEQQQGPALDSLFSSIASRPFSLDTLPLFQVHLIQLREAHHVLLLLAHHIAVDQWSLRILGAELSHCYNEHKANRIPTLGPVASFSEYAAQHRHWFETSEHGAALNYWRVQLEGSIPGYLPADLPRPPQQSHAGDAVILSLPAASIEKVQRAAASTGTTPAIVLLSCFQLLLYRYSSQHDLTIGMPIANRNHLLSEGLVGSLVNTLAIRSRLAGTETLAATIQATAQLCLDAYAHQDAPFEMLVKELNVERDPSRSPLFQTLFNFVNTPNQRIDFSEISWNRLEVNRKSAQFDLTLSIDIQLTKMLTIEYATALYERSTITAFGNRYLQVLSRLDSVLDQTLATIDINNSDELELIASFEQGNNHSLPTTTVLDLIANSAKQHGSKIALLSQRHDLTYDELEQLSTQVALNLVAEGLDAGSRVGVIMSRSADMLIAILGIMKAGAAYVPLDPGFPPARISHMISDAGLQIAITDQTAELPGNVDCTYRRLTSLLSHPTSPVVTLPTVTPDSPAYVIYTSGSTGLPKGVVIPHSALTNFLLSVAEIPGINASDRLLSVTTLSFDISLLELLLPLTVGASIYVADEEDVRDGQRLARLLHEQRISMMQATPSTWQLLLESGWQGASTLKILSGGEPLGRGLATSLLNRCQELWNLYGPTETTIWSTVAKVASAEARISIGRPLHNTMIRILDENLQTCPIGVAGELFIGGEGLALGYHNKPALTSERFIRISRPDGSQGERFYRTGDRGRWLPNGEIEHLGRLDTQIKLRGHRIEPEEIEQVLIEHDSISQAHVCLKQLGSNPHLIAYVTLQQDLPTPSEAQLRAHLEMRLPRYMLPTRILILDAMPLTPNNKVDPSALPSPSLPSQPALAAAPGSELESTLLSIWQELLGNSAFGVHDDFFSLGGHSLLAIRVCDLIIQRTGYACSLGQLFSNSTINKLATSIQESVHFSDYVNLSKTTTEKTLYCVCGIELFQPLADALAGNNVVKAAFLPWESNAAQSQEHPDAIRALASRYQAALPDAATAAPYSLAGFSVGGFIAYEMANQLAQPPTEVILFDTEAPVLRFIWAYRYCRVRLRLLFRPNQRVRDELFYLRLIRGYKPSHYDGKIILIRSRSKHNTNGKDTWRHYCKDLVIIYADGAHLDMLSGETMQQVANRIIDNQHRQPCNG